MRTWCERRGTPEPRRVRQAAAQGPAGARRVPRSRDDQRQPPLAPRGSVRDPRPASCCPSSPTRRRLKIWSAGSSYGAEAYTIAAIARESVPTVGVEIVGTDLDKRMVARAREGRFTAEDARTSPKALMQKHFDPQPDGGWEAKPELKRMVRFETGDLLRMAVPTARYDVVFCRNTVIYFTEEVRDALHERLVKALSPGRISRRRNLRACRRPARSRPHVPAPLHLPEELMDEYLPMFLAEGREHLQELNLAVVRIEETPGRSSDGRRDLPHRALAEGHERDDGLLGHGGADARDGGRLRAAAPAHGRPRARRRRRALRVPGRPQRRGRVDRLHRRRGDPAGAADRDAARARARAHARAGGRARRASPSPRRPSCPSWPTAGA